MMNWEVQVETMEQVALSRGIFLCIGYPLKILLLKCFLHFKCLCGGGEATEEEGRGEMSRGWQKSYDKITQMFFC